MICFFPKSKPSVHNIIKCKSLHPLKTACKSNLKNVNIKTLNLFGFECLMNGNKGNTNIFNVTI